MAWVDRSQGFLLEDLLAQRLRLSMVEHQSLADGYNRSF